MDTKGEIKKHSEAKLNLYQEYLKAYLPIMLHNAKIKHLWVFDVYAGEGRTKDNKEGSTVRFLNEFINALNVNTEKARRKDLTPLTFVVNELDTERNQKLTKVLNEITTQNNLNDRLELKILQMDALKLLDYLRDSVKKRVNDKFLFFIDPHGYTGMHKDLIEDLMSGNNAEVILFLPVNHIYRFKDSKKRKKEALDKFLESFFTETELEELKNLDEFGFIERINKKMKFDYRTYVSFYYIERDDKHKKYALFFVTKNLKGLEKFVKAKWKNDPIYGAGYRYKKKTKQLKLSFQEDIEKMEVYEYKKEKIKEFINKVSPNNKQLLIYVLEDLSLDNKIATQIIKELVKNKKIKIIDIESKNETKNVYLSYDALKKNAFKPKVKFYGKNQ